MANLENHGYRQSVKSKAYSKLNVPSYNTIKYRNLEEHQDDLQGLKEALVRRENASDDSSTGWKIPYGSIEDSKVLSHLDGSVESIAMDQNEKDEIVAQSVKVVTPFGVVEGAKESDPIILHPSLSDPIVTANLAIPPEDQDDILGEVEDDSESEVEHSDEEDEDDEDFAELQRELTRIKQERAEEKARQEHELNEQQKKELESTMLSANPLLAGQEFQMKKRWFEETVFRNQAQDEPKYRKRFINDTVRNDFHRRFLNKYIR